MPPEMTEEEKLAADKKAAKEARDKIPVEIIKVEEKQEEPDKEEENDEVEVGEDTEVEAEEEGQEEQIEENKDKIEEQKDKEEELKEQVANAENAKEREKFQKRLNREVSKRKALEDENKQLKAQLAAKPDATLTEEEVAKRAEAIATQKDAEREFIRIGNRLFDGAEKLDKDIKTKIEDLADDIGQIPSMLIGIMGDMSNGPAILKHFADNHDEAEKYFELVKNQPIRAAAEIAKLDLKLAPKPKPKSKVPPPNEPIRANGRTQSVEHESMNDSMADWVKKRNARLRAEGKL